MNEFAKYNCQIFQTEPKYPIKNNIAQKENTKNKSNLFLVCNVHSYRYQHHCQKYISYHQMLKVLAF